MVGVVHANSPLDAIQRFIGKIELGIIPNVLDTVVFVKDGRIEKVYELELKVKVPSGMMEQDLARPVIEVKNFATSDLEHEIYTFGEENVIVPVQKKKAKSGIEGLAEEKIQETFRRFDPKADVEIISEHNVKVAVQRQYIPSIIGRGGSTINDLEKRLKVHIDVVEKDNSETSSSSGEIQFSFSETKTALLLTVNREYTGLYAEVFVKDTLISSFRVAKKGKIKIPRRSDAAKKLMKLAFSQDDIRVVIRN